MAEIRIDKLNKMFGDVVAVKNLDLHVRDKEFVVLLGPSGCGKTTTLNCVAGLEEPTSGSIFVGGVDMRDQPPNKRNIAMVFQNYALYPHMNVYENMRFPLKMRRMPREEARERIEAAARVLDISELLDRKPRELSGGQRQRVALGRAIVREPYAFLMDEPLSNLDAALRVSMRSEIKKLHNKIGTTFVYVTHDQAEAMTLANRVALLKDAVLQQYTTPYELYHRPQNMFVAAFIGSPAMNFLPGEVKSSGEETFFERERLKVELPRDFHERAGALPDRSLILGVRPEDIIVTPAAKSPEGERWEILLEEPMGSDLFLEVNMGEQIVKIRTDGDLRLKAGDKICLSFKTEKLHLFDPATQKTLL